MSYNWQRAKEQEVDKRLILGPEQDVTGFRENMEVAYDFMVGEGLSSSASNAWRDPVEQQAKLLLDEPELSSFDRQILRGGSLSAKRDMLRKYQDTVAQRKNERQESGYRTHDEILEDIRKTLEPARKRYEDVSARATGWGVLGNLVGGFGGAVTDPINIATLAIATPRALYASGTLLQQAVKMAAFTSAVSAGTEAAIQPFVYEFKDEIGSPYTFKDAATNVLYAGVFGGVLGGLIPPVGYAAKAVTNRLVGEYRAKVASGQIKPDGDTQAAADVVEQFEEIIADNPLGMTDKGVQAHFEALDTARAQMVAGEPVDVQAIVAPHQRGIQSDSAATIPLDPREIDVDAELFQFKSLADAEGVTDRLAGVTKWEPELAGTSIVWQRKDGKLFVADGHQRLGLARRLLDEGAEPDSIVINAFVLREADGYSAREAMARAAAKNIAEGTGTAVDAAKVLRLAQTEGWGSRLPELPPNSALVRDARGLVKLGDEAFRAVVNEVIDDRYAALIGRFIDGDEQQLAAIQAMAKASPDNLMQAEIMARDMAAAGFTKSDQGNLFGDADFETLFKERAKAVDTIAKTLRQDRRTFKTLVDRQADIMGHGQNRLDVEANNLRASQDQLALASLMADATTPGPLSDAINQAAREIKAGKRPGAAVKEALAILRGTSEEPGPRPGQPVRRAELSKEEYRDAERAFADVQMGWDMDEIYRRAPANQERLAAVAKRIEQELGEGVEFANPGIKKRATAEGKMGRNGYQSPGRILDIVRGGFFVDDPEKALRVAKMLTDEFAALDEGIVVTPMGYSDIKVMIRFPDGQVSELQIWSKPIGLAKFKRGEALYVLMRDISDKRDGKFIPKPGKEAEFEGYRQESLDLYAQAVVESSPTWQQRILAEASDEFVDRFERYSSSANSPKNSSLDSSRIPETSGASNSTGMMGTQSPVSQLRTNASSEPTSDLMTTAGLASKSANRTALERSGFTGNTSDTILADDAQLFKQAEMLMARDPDAQIPDLRIDEDGNVAAATRPAREVFAELDAEGRALDDLITCISGSA